jgi:hypothetical protein
MPTSVNVTNLKINKLTEAQYDAAVQGGVIGENELSLLTDADNSSFTTATLAVNDWSSNTQTVSVANVTASNNVIVVAAPASQLDYANNGVLCTAQGAGTLTFTCTSTPANAITVNVLIFN